MEELKNEREHEPNTIVPSKTGQSNYYIYFPSKCQWKNWIIFPNKGNERLDVHVILSSNPLAGLWIFLLRYQHRYMFALHHAIYTLHSKHIFMSFPVSSTQKIHKLAQSNCITFCPSVLFRACFFCYFTYIKIRINHLYPFHTCCRENSGFTRERTQRNLSERGCQEGPL